MRPSVGEAIPHFVDDNEEVGVHRALCGVGFQCGKGFFVGVFLRFVNFLLRLVVCCVFVVFREKKPVTLQTFAAARTDRPCPSGAEGGASF